MKTIPYRLFSNCNLLGNLIFESGVEKIDFSSIVILCHLYIPDSVIEIKLADSRCKIHANKGSYAEQYASEHGNTFYANS